MLSFQSYHNQRATMESITDRSSGGEFSGVVEIEEEKIRSHLDAVVQDSVEETINGLLEAEADRLCNATRYERSPERVDTRAGHYESQLDTRARRVTLRMPWLRAMPFETQISERYRRRESRKR